MVIETYARGAEPVYARARERGRLLPDGLRYLDSWVIDGAEPGRCFQLMETDDPALLDTWRSRWSDLVDFEVFPVINSAAAARQAGVTWTGGPGPDG
jgi:Protein of unknown function (DUF3303)